jgi:glutamine phosphoribosylpyrophosphate amidotransferase
MIFGSTERQPEEQSYLKWLFIYLLLLSERRGPYATGAGSITTEGDHSIVKRPLPAAKFVRERAFVDLLSEVDDSTTWLAGHTRWPTRGSVERISNAHPIRSGAICGTHNGTIINADALFRKFDLPRFAEVDSEILFRMTDATVRDSRIDIEALTERLALCRGQISAVMASKLDPKAVIVVKGNMPLELRYHPEHQVIVYASDPWYLDVALSSGLGWQEIITRPMTIMSFRTNDLLGFKTTPFKLAGRTRS